MHFNFFPNICLDTNFYWRSQFPSSICLSTNQHFLNESVPLPNFLTVLLTRFSLKKAEFWSHYENQTDSSEYCWTNKQASPNILHTTSGFERSNSRSRVWRDARSGLSIIGIIQCPHSLLSPSTRWFVFVTYPLKLKTYLQRPVCLC